MDNILICEKDNFDLYGEEYGVYIEYFYDSIDDDKGNLTVIKCDLEIGCGAWLVMDSEYFPLVEIALSDYIEAHSID